MRVLAILFLCLWQFARAEIYSCGGFVKSSLPIDYSKIKVKLLTPEGHMKHEEDCNPQNGYYMIPIYNKGQYSLKVSAPEGWYFEPETIDFKLDGVNDPCTKNEDINFELAAFSVQGVVDDGSGSGPAGLPLTIRKDGKVIETIETTKGGHYRFRTVPGTYEVSTASSTSACIGVGSAKVVVKNEPVTVTPALRISGYHLSIAVSNKNSPLANVPITLFSATEKNIKGCVLTKEKYGSAKFACAVGTTGANGALEVPCAPIGEYHVKPELADGEVVFQFAPNVAPVTVKNDKVQVSFSVSGFSARVRVTSPAGPVPDAEVFLAGKGVGRTDKEGFVTLEGLKEGKVELTAQAPNTKFAVVKANLKLPQVKIPDVTVESFEVCGSVEQFRGSVESLVLQRKDKKDTVSIRPASDGSFCKMVKPGKYVISAMKLTAVGPQMRSFTSRLRHFSTQSSFTQAPIVFVKEGTGPRANSLLGPSDKQFPFPGDVSHRSTLNSAAKQPSVEVPKSAMKETSCSLDTIMGVNRVDADTNYLRELQEQALEDAQDRAGDWPVELTAQKCPRLLKKDLKFLFPDIGLEKSEVNVLNLTQKTEHDMSAWSREMEEERDELTASFIASGQAICTALRSCGYWADFVDPASGRPYLGHFSNIALFETDDAYKYMGFKIEDLGCCKVLQHMTWGTHAFVGTLFTDAPLDSQIMKDIVAKVNEEAEVSQE